MDIDETALLASVNNPAPAPQSYSGLGPAQSQSASSSTSTTTRKIKPPNPPQLRLPTPKPPIPKKFVPPPPSNIQPDTSKQRNILSYMKPVPAKLPPANAPRPTVPPNPNDDEDIDILELDEESSESSSVISAAGGGAGGKISKITGTGRMGMEVCYINEKTTEISKAPYQYIKQINAGQFKVGEVISVRGIIATIASNIQVDKPSGEWKLSVNINDGSGYLVASISTNVSQFVK
jgi:hypothetical protein